MGVAGLAVGLAFLVTVHPRMFPKLSAIARQPFRDVGADALPRFSTRLLAEGLALAVVALWIRRRLRSAGLETVLGLVVPFAAFMLAEELEASGVLADTAS